jgi:hypothetical protein
MFTIKNTTIPLRITYGMAIVELPRLGIELLKLFSDQTVVGKVARALHVNDIETIDLLQVMAIKNIGRALSPEELDELDGPKMDEFRNCMWEAIENFSGAHRKTLVQQIKAEVLANLQSQTLEESSSVSSPEQESPPGITPSVS